MADRGKGGQRGRATGRGRGGERGRGRGRGDFGGGGRGDFGGGGPGREQERGRPSGQQGRGGRPSGPVIYERFRSASADSSAEETYGFEDVIQQRARSRGPLELPDLDQLSFDERTPRRPGYGTLGNKVTLRANYYPIHINPKMQVWSYSVNILERSKSNRDEWVSSDIAGGKRRRLVQQLLESPRLQRVRAVHGVATDFKSTMVTTSELEEESLTGRITYQPEGTEGITGRSPEYEVVLNLNCPLPMQDLLNYVSSPDLYGLLKTKSQFIQALNIIIGHFPKFLGISTDTFMTIASAKYFALTGRGAYSYDLGGGLMAWRGYFMTVKTVPRRLMLNMQIKHAAAYKAGPVDAVMRDLGRFDPRRWTVFFKGVRVNLLHLKKPNGEVIKRVKTIWGLAEPRDGRVKRAKNEPPPTKEPKVPYWGAKAHEVHFWFEPRPPPGGKSGPTKPAGFISVAEYFRSTYGLTVSRDSPVLNIGNKNFPTYVPADQCSIVPGQPASQKLTAMQTRNMINFAVRRPFENARSIAEESKQALKLDPVNAEMAQCNIALGQQMIEVAGRILKCPSVYYAGNKDARPQFGGWNMRDIKFARGAALKAWIPIAIKLASGGAPGYRDVLPAAIAGFRDEMIKCGMNIEQCGGLQFFNYEDGANEDVRNANVDRYFKQAITVKRQPQLILFILPEAHIDLYNKIKRYGDCIYGIHTVCVVGTKFCSNRHDRGFDLQYFANVALKFNLKLGGRNQFLAKQGLGIIGDNTTMLVGIDVTHPSPGSTSMAPSVASVVASIDGTASQFPGVIQVQEARQEMVHGLGEAFQSRLRLWQKYNNQQLPQNVIIYRDGVSEGQYEHVLEVEMPLLRDACIGTSESRRLLLKMSPQHALKPIYRDNKAPKMTLIIVSKRHHTRFFPTRADSEEIDIRSSNCKNGTVVDRSVTDPRMWDFYLQSHTALQGTARPGHYIVAHDEVFAGQGPKSTEPLNRADKVQELTHNLCYMFGRATKAVSIPPPVYYADLLAERARKYLASEFDPSEPEMSLETESTTSAGAQPQTAAGGQSRRDQMSSLRRQQVVANARAKALVHPAIADTMFYI